MNDWQRTVREFQTACGQSVGERPGAISPKYAQFLLTIMSEEDHELECAMLGEDIGDFGGGDLAHIAGELVDKLWTTLCTANAYGIDLDPFFKAIGEANMAKSKGPLREDGKRLKPLGWQPAPLKELLQAQYDSRPSDSA